MKKTLTNLWDWGWVKSSDRGHLENQNQMDSSREGSPCRPNQQNYTDKAAFSLFCKANWTLVILGLCLWEPQAHLELFPKADRREPVKTSIL